jgi:hypothetical protein
MGVNLNQGVASAPQRGQVWFDPDPDGPPFLVRDELQEAIRRLCLIEDQAFRQLIPHGVALSPAAGVKAVLTHTLLGLDVVCDGIVRRDAPGA